MQLVIHWWRDLPEVNSFLQVKVYSVQETLPWLVTQF